jgi:hypothetical protein
MRGCCTGRASDLDVLVQLVRGASFGRGRASSAPVAGALSSVHPGDTSYGVMTGHPDWPHAVVKTVGLRATGCRGFNAWRRGQPWALSKATCESANRLPTGCGAAGDDGIAAPFVARKSTEITCGRPGQVVLR